MEAVVLAAGEGRRLYPFTAHMPKVMLPIANKPIIDYVITALAANNICDIVVVTGYREETVRSFLGNGEAWGVKITYVTQDRQIGTGDALLQAKPYINGPFLTLPGDNIIDHDSLALLADSRHDTAVLIEESLMASKYGVVTVQKDLLTEIKEKPQEATTNLVSTGIYKLQTSVFDGIEQSMKQGSPFLTDVVKAECQAGVAIDAIKGTGMWMDVVYPWNILDVNAHVLQPVVSQQAGIVEDNVIMKGAVRVGADSVIRAGCYIVGPVVIGAGCEIGPNTCIFPATTIGNNVVIYPYSDISYSVIMDETTIDSHCHISHSVIGRNTILNAFVSTRYGRASMLIEDTFYTVEDIGCFIGDDSSIGDHTIIEPAVALGDNSYVSPSNIVRKNLPPKSNVM